jgi:hypothetical protein
VRRYLDERTGAHESFQHYLARHTVEELEMLAAAEPLEAHA